MGQIQLCDISLDEGGIVMVTIVLSVLLHKAFHEVHSRHMGSLTQQVGGVAAGKAHQDYIYAATFSKYSSVKTMHLKMNIL